MDRYHSIVGPMVSYHWKPLKNHRVQWLPDNKTIEKPLVPMVFRPKTIGKPLLPMVLETKNHRKTIDINGGFPTIHSMAMVSIKTFKCCNGGNHKANIELKWFPRNIFVTLGQVSLSKVCLPLCFCWKKSCFFAFWPFLWTSVHFPHNHS